MPCAALRAAPDKAAIPGPIAASRPDPLASFERVVHLAGDRRSRLVDLGNGGHIDPASGYGPWPGAKELLRELL
ncbi:alpha/beta hydrolase [Cupriavidus sp. 2MCAB6]|uniref:alpha/beta hydrolase n=1 Tax=Cupriavidus sp. 2MCAB6 TaxID=3232981 RepID=UPI003F8F5CF5